MENRNFIITNAHKFGHNSKGIELSDIKNDVDLLIINHFSAKKWRNVEHFIGSKSVFNRKSINQYFRAY